MLNKDPDLRPSVRDLLCTDFFKMHITKLLSHTLLNNKGGAEADAVTGEEDRSRGNTCIWCNAMMIPMEQM